VIRHDTRAPWAAAAGSHIVDGLEAYGVQQTTGGPIRLGGFDFYVESNHQAIGTCGQTANPFGCDSTPSAGQNIILLGDVHQEDTEGGPNELRFDGPILAFGVDVLAVEDEEYGSALHVTIGGEQFSVSSGFFGVVSDTPFDLVLIEGPRVAYALDDISYSPVPEPCAGLLLGMGLSVLSLQRRRSPQGRPAERAGRWPGTRPERAGRR
jgi:hypothetical protein